MRIRIINRYEPLDSNAKPIYKLNTPLFVILLLFLMLNMTSANMQAVIMAVASLYPIFKWFKQKKVNSFMLLFCLFVFFLVMMGLTSTHAITTYYLISELKILILFTLPFFFYFLLEGLDYKVILNQVFHFYISIVLIVTSYGYLTTGRFRDTGFLGFSIYISVTLVLFLSQLYYETSLYWKILTLISIFMLGSSNGLIAYFILIIIKAGIPRITKVIPTILAAVISYWYITEFRGRELLNGGFWTIDRVLISTSVIRYTGKYFDFWNYLLGFGIGKSLNDFHIISPIESDQINGFIKWFMGVNSGGVYPFSFHNEFLRIFYNFGLIGLFLILVYLYKYLDRTTFVILLITCLTNTIIYSTIGLFTLSFLIAVNQLEKADQSSEG